MAMLTILFKIAIGHMIPILSSVISGIYLFTSTFLGLNLGPKIPSQIGHNDGNGTLIRQEMRTDKDQFQFGGHPTYTFSYDGNGNLTQTRIDTNDYWVTFDAKGNQTGFGYSVQMQNYINELQRQAEEAECEAKLAMRDAESKIQEAIKAEIRAMEEEAASTVVRVETYYKKVGKNKYDVVTRYWYADGSYTEGVQRVKGKSKAKQKAEEARCKS